MNELAAWMSADIPTSKSSTQGFGREGWLIPSAKAKSPDFPVAFIKSTDKSVTVHNHHIDRMAKEMKSLREELNELKNIVAGITGADVITIRDIPYEKAKREIRQFFADHHGGDFNAADMEEKLGIDFDMALEICQELENEGKNRKP